MARLFGGRIDCLNPVVTAIKGTRRVCERLFVHIVADAAAGITPDRDDLGRLTLTRIGKADDDPAGNTIVGNVLVHAFMALDEYLEGTITDSYTEGGACEAYYFVPFDILPRLKPGLANGIFMPKEDYLDFEQETLAAATFDTCVEHIYRQIHTGAEALYIPYYEEFPYQLSSIGEVTLHKNLAYLMLYAADATVSTITRIEVREGERLIARYESWADLIADTESRAQQEAAATWGIIDVSMRGQDRPALTNDAVLEITGGTGTIKCVRVNIGWTPGSQVQNQRVQSGAIREMSERIAEGGGSSETVGALVRPELSALPVLQVEQAKVESMTEARKIRELKQRNRARTTGLVLPVG